MWFPMRSKTALALVALSCLAAAQTRAQDFPSRIVRLVVAFPAGGPTDLVARLIADKLKPRIGQNVIIENKPGANGAIGADYVAKGEADACSCRTNRSWSSWPMQRRIRASSHWHRPAAAARRI